jgi:hypothetical protein
MAESLPLPHALRFLIADDDEWQAIQPYLEPGEFPTGLNSWLNEGDPAFGRASDLIGELYLRLAAALSDGRLLASGRRVGATHTSQTEGARCEEVEILGENGTSLRIHGLDYAGVWLTKPDLKDGSGKIVEKRKLEGELTRGLEPFIARLIERHGQTTYKELRNFLEARGLPPFAESLLKKCARGAGLTEGMIRRGRPREANPARE